MTHWPTPWGLGTGEVGLGVWAGHGLVAKEKSARYDGQPRSARKEEIHKRSALESVL